MRALSQMEVKMSHSQQSADKDQPQPQLAGELLSLRKPISVENSNFNYHLLQSATLIEQEILSFAVNPNNHFSFTIPEYLCQEVNAFGCNVFHTYSQHVNSFRIKCEVSFEDQIKYLVTSTHTYLKVK